MLVELLRAGVSFKKTFLFFFDFLVSTLLVFTFPFTGREILCGFCPSFLLCFPGWSFRGFCRFVFFLSHIDHIQTVMG